MGYAYVEHGGKSQVKNRDPPLENKGAPRGRKESSDEKKGEHPI